MNGLPADVQAILDKMGHEFARAFEQAIDRVTSAAEVQKIEDAIRARDYAGAYALLSINDATFAELDYLITDTMWRGGQAMISTASSLSGVTFGFSGRSPGATAWAAQEAGRLITEIVADQRSGIVEYLAQGIDAGRSPRSVALELVGRIDKTAGKRTGGIVGLTSQQMQWVANARAELSDPLTMRKFLERAARDRRFDRTINKAIREGKPLDASVQDKIAADYSARLLKYRGKMIARTEALNSLRAGRHEAFRQAIARGELRADQITVTWSSTPDKFTRHSHMTLDGKKVQFGQVFVTENGSRLEYPGDTSHGALAKDIIQCRCYAAYRVKRDG